LLREREFKRFPVTLTISPPSAEQAAPLRIVFGREPVNRPFVLTLATGDAHVAIHATGSDTLRSNDMYPSLIVPTRIKIRHGAGFTLLE